MPFSALLDANVLVPNALRDTLLRVAEADLYRPLWSQDILAETRRTILRLCPDINSGRLDAMFAGMNEVFSDALVTGYEPLIEGMTNDKGDRHVLAAAVIGRADVIVTNNVKALSGISPGSTQHRSTKARPVFVPPVRSGPTLDAGLDQEAECRDGTLTGKAPAEPE